MIAGRPAADFPTEEHSPAQELAPHQHAPLPASYSELRVLGETLGVPLMVALCSAIDCPSPLRSYR